MTSILPNELLPLIYSFLPAEDIATNCRFVCKYWEEETQNETVWANIAASYDVDEPEAGVGANEMIVRQYLKEKRLETSSAERVKRKVTQFFAEIAEGERKALEYISLKESKDPKVCQTSILCIATRDLADHKMMDQNTHNQDIIDIFDSIDTSLLIVATGDTIEDSECIKDLFHAVVKDYPEDAVCAHHLETENRNSTEKWKPGFLRKLSFQ